MRGAVRSALRGLTSKCIAWRWLPNLSRPARPSEPGWDAPGGAGGGGALRAYVRGPTVGAACGAHEQNLQVGWREVRGAAGSDGASSDGAGSDETETDEAETEETGSDEAETDGAGAVEPVFLDCFLQFRHPGLPAEARRGMLRSYWDHVGVMRGCCWNAARMLLGGAALPL